MQDAFISVNLFIISISHRIVEYDKCNAVGDLSDIKEKICLFLFSIQAGRSAIRGIYSLSASIYLFSLQLIRLVFNENFALT